MPKHPLLRRLTIIPVGAICMLLCGFVFAGETTPNTPQVKESLPHKISAREQAKASIPWEKLTTEARQRLDDIVTDSSVFHRSPFEKTSCDHNVYLHLIRHPEVVVNIWELMGISRLRMDREQKYLININDGYGTQSQLELVYGNKNLHIFYAEGAYKGSIIPMTSKGKVVLILETVQTMEEDKPVISHRLNMFIQFDKSTNQVIVKALQGLFLKMVDMNFSETTKFIGQIDKIIQNNAAGMKRLSGRLTRVRTPIREQFNRLIERANTHYQRVASNSK
ncbi:MAG: hypothetical protein CMJ76_15940 [Planctomycetaceae bacterium]|nr:hypothetical protein [Planctomycetaceae bacterium]